MKGMILAAGLGTRMRPLTLHTPKALLLLNGRPLIAYSIDLLKKFGFDEIIINTHHLAELIQKELGSGKKFGVKITYSFEPEILGTGGGIQNVLDYFGGKSFPVLNTDTLIDANLKKLVAFHKKKKGLATMLLRPGSEEYTAISINKNDRITSIGKREGDYWMFTGVHIINPKLLEYLSVPSPSCIVKNAYIPALANGEKIFGFRHDGYWTDIGTLELYQLL